MKVSVISSGSWGTALAKVLCDNGHETTMWGRSSEAIEDMRQTRENRRYLKGETLPESLQLTSDFAEAVTGAELLILSTPSQFMRKTLCDLRDLGQPLPPVVNVSKGIEVGSLKRSSSRV